MPKQQSTKTDAGMHNPQDTTVQFKVGSQISE